MKTRNQVLTFVFIFLLSGLTSLFGAELSTPKKGDNVIKETREVGSFTGISASGAFDIYVKQTGTNSVVIEADEEIMQYITTEVVNGILKIGMKKPKPKCWNHVQVLRAYITVADLKSVDLSGAVEFTTETKIKGDKLVMEISGAVEADLNLDVQKLLIEMSGASELDIQGQAQEASIEASGASDMDISDFQVVNLSVYASGACDAKVYATGTLNVSASGACDVRYKGGASVNVHTSGACSVKKYN